jgi:hypothetical protein
MPALSLLAQQVNSSSIAWAPVLLVAIGVGAVVVGALIIALVALLGSGKRLRE